MVAGRMVRAGQDRLARNVDVASIRIWLRDPSL
jgi:hypothetical protein